MNFAKTLRYSVVALSVAACSSAPARPPFKGYPFVDVKGINAEEIQSRFSVNCLDGGRISQVGPYSLTCARPMGDSIGELMYRGLLTEKYASNPEIMTQTAWAKTVTGTMRITVTVWFEHQNAFGKTTREGFNDDNTKYTIQGALDNFKRSIEESRSSK